MNDKIVNILEGFDLKPDQIDEVMVQLENIKNDPEKIQEFNDTTDALLRSQLSEAVDWKKRAAIAAAIISRNLEN